MVPVSNDAEHGELRETVLLNPTNPIEDTTSGIDKHTYRVTSMKRSKPTNLGSSDKLIKPYKRFRSGAASHDRSLSNGNLSKEVRNSPVVHAVDKTKKLFRGKKTAAKQDKRVESKLPVVESARKKGKLSADSRALKTLHLVQPAKQDNRVELKRPMINSARKKGKLSADSRGLRALLRGSQCHAMTTRSKKSEQSTSRVPQNVGEPNKTQSGVRLAPKKTGLQDKETKGDTSISRRRGRKFTMQSKTRKTSLALIHQNGDGGVKKLPNRRRIELTSQQEKSNKLVKGKRGRRRTISLNIESSPQDLQDSSKHKKNGKTNINVEKSVDTVSEDQPLSNWFLGKKPPGNSKFPPSMTKDNDPKLSFEKQSSLWETIESMEAFHVVPQRPHFRPLDNLKESARERQAIYKMVDFSGVYEKMCHFRLDHPRTEIEDQLETLLELETYGFDVEPIRNRLMKMLSLKDKLEALETQSKESKDNLESQCVKFQEHDKDIELIDNQLDVLLNKRERLVKENEETELNIVALEEKINGFEEAYREFRRKFEELATASFLTNNLN